MPSLITTSLHDLLVGLLCFDKIYLSLHAMGKLHTDVGAEFFWRLIDQDAIRFVWTCSNLVMTFPSPEAVSGGDIGCITPMDKNDPSTAISFREVVLNQIKPADATEENCTDLVAKIEKLTIRVDETLLNQIPNLTRGALLMPKLREKLGIADSIFPTKIPEWLAFPSLRVASVVRDAEICRTLGVASAKMPFGADALANATYGLITPKEYASEMASYVVAGSFSADLGELVLKNANLTSRIMDFRESQTGINFRAEIFEKLEVNAGSEFVSSINSGLAQNIPKTVLEKARSHFNNLHLAPGATALWSGPSDEDKSLRLWRQRSSEMLSAVCKKMKIEPYDFCPCGSGDKLKFCCGILFK